MSDFTVTRTLTAPHEKVWQILTQPSHFEGWLPAKPGTAVLDVRTGGSWQATVISSDGEEIALTGRYYEVSEPERLVAVRWSPTEDSLFLVAIQVEALDRHRLLSES